MYNVTLRNRLNRLGTLVAVVVEEEDEEWKREKS